MHIFKLPDFQLPLIPCAEEQSTEDPPSVTDVPVSCGYEADLLQNAVKIPFTGCHVKHVANCTVSTLSL